MELKENSEPLDLTVSREDTDGALDAEPKLLL